ncbi:MAG: hypothetical protein FWE91_10785 [Defluviitaleaceae bacterium]|nr:hypothetical protein [Defluviitaleaceae bacterium]MCL2836331.1 hypothetical protein [Defluviitaleaceae bacterium]
MFGYGIEVNIKNKPELDPEFIPLHKFNEIFLKTASIPFSFAAERNDKQIFVRHTHIRGDEAHANADRYFIDRLVKFEIWQKGGFRIYETLANAMLNVAQYERPANGVRCLGINMEGPFFSRGKRGAHPADLVLLDNELFVQKVYVGGKEILR